MNKTVLIAVLLLWAFTAFAREIPIRNTSSTCAWVTIYEPRPAGPPTMRKTRKDIRAYWIKAGAVKKENWSDGGFGAEVRAEFMTNVNCDHPVLRDISVFKWKKDGWPSEFVLRGQDRATFGIDIK
ncbi:MAG TPA: hypothetical protein VKU62_05925 [Thermoanaerobaculia bacterium]|nr:hypothetical protein [Thermoanaerobaculia bacterium]